MSQIEDFKPLPEKLDKKDLDILNILKKDCRESYKKIGRELSISHDSIAYRIKRLEKLGIIEGYTIDVNYNLLGYSKYFLLIQIIESNSSKVNELYSFLDSKKEIVNVLYYTDKWDLKIEILAKNHEELDNIITELNGKYSEIMIDQELLLNIKNLLIKNDLKKQILPSLDKTDLKILDILKNNSKESLVNIARQVGLNADTVMYRIKKYERNNLITRFRVRLNFNRLGFQLYSLRLLLKYLSKDEEKKIISFCKRKKEIISGNKTIGDWNIILNVLSRDAYHFHKILNDLKSLIGLSLKDYDALLAYKEIKDEPLIW